MSTLQLRALARFPANVVGTGGIGVLKENGEWTIFPDFASLDVIIATALGDPSSKQIWIYDPLTTEYNVLTLAGLGDALYKATSTSSLVVGTGSKTFITQSGKDFGVGSFVLATSDADPTDFMLGQVTSYVGTSLVVNVTTVGGSGTDADWTIRASASAGSAGRSAGYLYSFSTSTAATDPTTGKLKVNNASLALATAVYISETDSDNNNLATLIASWDDGTSAIRGRLTIYNPDAPASFAVYDVTGSNTDNGAWVTLNVTYVTGAGAFTITDSLRVQFVMKGDKGNTGTDGRNSGLKYTFNSGTSGDPGVGQFLFNNATFGSVTALNISETDGDANGISTYLATWDDSTSTVKGTIILFKPTNGAVRILQITGSITDSGAYDTLSVTPLTSSGSISNGDVFYIFFIPTGDKGTDGVGAGDMIGANNLVVGAGGVASATTSRTNLGIGTGDSPQFAGLNIGNASDTTVTRTGAGDIAVEGNAVYRAGGTDVAIADGGTGASTAANAFAALKQDATTSATGVSELATTAEMATGTDAGRVPSVLAVRDGTGAGWASFSVHKNSVDQTGIVNSTYTQVSFGTELYDVGSKFAANGWTPPLGKIHIDFSFFLTGTIAVGALCIAAVYKNGVLFKQGNWFAGANNGSGLLGFDDSANGTDIYEFYVFIQVTGTATINGNPALTFATGHMIN